MKTVLFVITCLIILDTDMLLHFKELNTKLDIIVKNTAPVEFTYTNVLYYITNNPVTNYVTYVGGSK